MDSEPTTAGSAPVRPKRRHLLGSMVLVVIVASLLYVLVAYVLMPLDWRWYFHRHPGLDDAPRITQTSSGIPGDPLNVGVVGTEDEIKRVMLAARWFPADPLTLRSCLKIASGTVFHRPYDDAPVSNLDLWGRREDLAFEQPLGHDPRRRHHVRFWRSETLDSDRRPIWLGAATFDTSVGLSHTTGQITHHISPDIDAERDKLMEDLKQTGCLETVYEVPGFQEKLEGRNGGGDPYRTDGSLSVAVIEIHESPE